MIASGISFSCAGISGTSGITDECCFAVVDNPAPNGISALMDGFGFKKIRRSHFKRDGPVPPNVMLDKLRIAVNELARMVA